MSYPEPERTPGDILRRDYLDRYEITQRALAEHIGCDVKVVNSIVNGRSAVTAEMALKLAAAFQTEPATWLRAQQAVDLHKASTQITKLPKAIARNQMALPL